MADIGIQRNSQRPFNRAHFNRHRPVGLIIYEWRHTPGASVKALLEDVDAASGNCSDERRTQIRAQAMFYGGMDEEALRLIMPLFDLPDLSGKILKKIGGLRLAITGFDPETTNALEEKFPNDFPRMFEKGMRYHEARKPPQMQRWPLAGLPQTQKAPAGAKPA